MSAPQAVPHGYSIQATVHALHMAKHSGDVGVADVIPGPSVELAKSEDITREVLSVVKLSQVSLPECGWFGFQKAAVTSFQTWALRSSRSDLVGLLLGTEVKKRTLCHTIIVADDIDCLTNDKKINYLLKDMNLTVMGLVVVGHPSKEREWVDWLLAHVHFLNSDANLAIYAPWASNLTLPIYIPICNSLCIFTRMF